MYFISISGKELIFGMLLLLLTTVLVAGSRWSRLYNEHAVSSDQEVQLYLDDLTGLDELTELLADSSLINSPSEFKWAAKLLGWKRFHRGHYVVDRGYQYDEFLSKLARGIQDPISITILPGRSIKEVTGMISRKIKFDSLAFHRAITDSAYLSNFGLQKKDVIGRMYPNTYSVYWTSTPKAFFERIIGEFDQAVIAPNRKRFKALDRSINDIITLASIVEWEARNQEEKPIISGLYWNRLERGMRLQADPTVNFAVGERRRLLYKDYQIDHPYNTYIHRGLPPGPITNPDLASIEAALQPEEHNYLYMVATPEGEHAFSTTFKEHKQKSAQWRQWLKEQYRIKRMQERDSSKN